MPEGDSLVRAARTLDPVLTGHELTRSEFRVPTFAAADLTGQTVSSVRPRGKWLLIETSEPAAEPGAAPGAAPTATIVLHLKMEGRLHAHPLGTRWRFPAHTARLVLATATHEVVGTELGRLEVLAPHEAATRLDHLGPDVLGADWDPVEVERRLRARPHRAIGDALLDQRVLAGVGNIYRNEICFLRGLDPATPVASVPDLSALVGLTRRVMVANVGRPRRVFTGDTRPGRSTYVYDRAGRPCRRCAMTIRSRTHTPADGGDSLDRIVFWCPHCQPEPSAGESR